MDFDDLFYEYREVMYPKPTTEQGVRDQVRKAKALIRKMKPKTVEERELKLMAEEGLYLRDIL